MEGLQDLSAAESADVVVIPAWHDDLSPPSDSLSEALRAAHGCGASIAGLCLGAFAVARARLLKGHPAVTLWQALDEFSRRHSDISVDQTVLYIDHRDVLTSAGTAAGIDACLHVVRTRLGADAANQVARSLVVAPHRGEGRPSTSNARSFRRKGPRVIRSRLSGPASQQWSYVKRKNEARGWQNTEEPDDRLAS